MKVQFKDLKVGLKVKVATWDGRYNIGIIENVEEEIKNGYPGIDYVTTSGDYHWCYLDQIVAVGF